MHYYAGIMKLALRLSASLLPFAALALAACAHDSNAPPPQVSTTSTTSAALSVERSDVPASAPTTMPDLTYRPSTDPIHVQNDTAIEEWSDRYPDAATELGMWIDRYPNAAKRMAEWDDHHPIRMSTIVDWAVTHRYESIEAFLYGRAGWQDLRGIAQEDRQAMNELIDWIRRSPHAAAELVTHPDALGWTRAHLADGKARNAQARKAAPSPQQQVAAPAGPADSVR